MSRIREVGIAGTGHHVPERILSNFDFEKMVDTSDEWIVQRTGMRERRIAAEGEACSDLCVVAAERALEDAGLAAADLDLILVATVTPDYLLPNVASLVQARLGAWNAGGWDVTNACSGFLSAMMSARAMIAAGDADNALIIGAEVLSSILDYEDRASCILFGDGAGAMVLKADHERGRIIHTESGMDGRQWDAIQRLTGGSREPLRPENIGDKRQFMSLKGNEVYKFAVNKFRDLIERSLVATGHAADELTMVVPHQVNRRIIESAVEKLDIDLERVYINLDRFGNTSAASIPIAFDEMRRARGLEPGALVSFVAFGAGLAWGSALVRW